jgi:hypothetical protein
MSYISTSNHEKGLQSLVFLLHHAAIKAISISGVGFGVGSSLAR